MPNMSLKKNEMPAQPADVRNGNFDEVALGYTEEQALDEAARCLHCKNKPCREGCPVGIDIPAFIARVVEKDYEGAYQVIAESSSLPAVCGRVCPQETQCEKHCVRAIKGESVGIGRLERFVADYHNTHSKAEAVRPAFNGHRVAVIGSGPAGLTCAGELARKGYAVTVFEALHLAGGVMGVLSELKGRGLLDENALTVSGMTLGEEISLSKNYNHEVIRPFDEPYSPTGGLMILRGNLAPDGAVVKTAGVPKEIWKFRGPALVVESQEQAVEVILNDTLKPGQALIIRYEGPKGGPGMQEMLYPTSFVKGKGIGKDVALITDGRYSGGSSGLSIGHVAPEAASGGNIALVENGDIITIDIPNRTINVELTDEELAERRAKLEAGDGYVAHRDRKVSQALKAFAAFARSADKGATRDPELIDRLSGLA